MKNLSLLLFAVLITFGAFSQDCQKLYDQASARYNSKKYDEALKIVNSGLTCEASKSNDLNTYPLFQLKGDCHYEMGDYKSAKSAFQASINVITKANLLKERRRSWLNLGNTYDKLGIKDSAESSYRTGIKYFIGTEPNELLSELFRAYANLLYKDERYPEYNKAHQLGAKVYESSNSSAANTEINNFLEGTYLKSTQDYSKLNQADLNYLESLGDLYGNKDKYDKADSIYNLCLKYYELSGADAIGYSDLLYNKALNNEMKGDYVTAIKNLEKSISITKSREAKGKKAKAVKAKDYADQMYKIAELFTSLGSFSQAENYFKTSLKLYDSLKLTAEKVNAIRRLGGLYLAWGNMAKAFQFKRNALLLTKKYKHPDLNAAYVQFEIGALYRITFQFDSSLYYYNQTESTYRQELGIENTTYASLLYQFSQTYYYMGNIDSTENILKRRLQIYKSINPKSLDYATGMFDLGTFYSNVGRINEAEQFYLGSIKIQREQSGNTLSLGEKLGSVGWFYMGLGDYMEAEKYYDQARAMVESINGKNCIQYAARLNESGTLNKIKGLYAKSEELLLEYVKIEERKRGKTSAGYATARNNLGTLYSSMGQKDKALQCYQDAVKINEAIYGRESENYALNVSNLAIAYEIKENYQKADSLHSIVVAIRNKYFGRNHPKTIGTLSDLAIFEKLQGKYQQSISHYDEVIEYRKDVYGEKNLNTLYTLEGKGELLTKMGNYKESVIMLQPILPAYKISLGENHPSYAGVNRKMGLNFLGQYDFKQAANYFKATLDVRFFQIDKTFSSLTEKQREDVYTSIKLDFDLFNSVALVGAGKIGFMGKKNSSPDPKLIQDLYNNQVATKAFLLSSSVRQRKQILSGSDKILKEKYFEWEKLKAQLASLYQKESPDQKGEPNLKIKISRDSLEERIDKLERELSAKSERFAKAEDKKKYTWKDIQTKLKPGEAAIEIIRMQKYGLKEWVLDESDPKKTRYPKIDLTDTILYAALIVTNETVAGPELVLLTEGNSMESEFLKLYQSNIYLKHEDVDSYNKFWKPIASHPVIKGKVKKVYFSPDGIYNQISINSLLNPESKKFVIDELDVQMVTNSKDILITKKSDEYNYYCMFIGNPNFYADKKSIPAKADMRSYSLTRGGGLSSLPGAEREVDVIKALLDSASSSWDAHVFKGKDATEYMIKREMNNPRILHIATHGFFEQSAGVEGTRGGGVNLNVSESKTVSKGPHLNPMLASGLFLQGGGDALAKLKTFDYELLDCDDGILTAYEAMNLNIENTELVILSACETGLGEVNNGEGVYGLQRALKVAGANAIVMSLWSVSDDATMILMREFYKHWLKSGDKQASFKEAQLAVRNTKSFAHPFFWSAFVMVGN